MLCLFFRTVELDLEADEAAMEKLERVRQDFLPLRIFLEEGDPLESLTEHARLWVEVLPAKGLFATSGLPQK